MLLANKAPPHILDNRPDVRHRALFVTSRAAWRWNKMLLARENVDAYICRRFCTSNPWRVNPQPRSQVWKTRTADPHGASNPRPGIKADGCCSAKRHTINISVHALWLYCGFNVVCSFITAVKVHAWVQSFSSILLFTFERMHIRILSPPNHQPAVMIHSSRNNG